MCIARAEIKYVDSGWLAAVGAGGLQRMAGSVIAGGKNLFIALLIRAFIHVKTRDGIDKKEL